jgi:tetratricopeptide (TPR) repeat protein
MKKALLIFLCVALTAAVLSSQDYKGKGRVSGVVLDQDQKPIEGAKLKFFLPKANGGFEITTDKEGKWIAAWIAQGAWNLDVEKFGYEPKKLVVDIAEQRKNPEMKISLKKVEGLILTDELKDMLIKANQLFDQKNYQGALEGYQAILAKFPEAFPIQRNVGNAYFAMEKYDLAEETYKKILDKEPTNVEVTLAIGNCYANRGQSDKAIEWYNKIQFDNIKDATVLYNIGTNYYNLSKFEDALKYYKRSVEVQTDYLDGIYQLGLTYTSLQKTAEAIATFEQYIKLDPDSPRSAQVKGFLDYLKKK